MPTRAGWQHRCWRQPTPKRRERKDAHRLLQNFQTRTRRQGMTGANTEGPEHTPGHPANTRPSLETACNGVDLLPPQLVPHRRKAHFGCTSRLPIEVFTISPRVASSADLTCVRARSGKRKLSEASHRANVQTSPSFSSLLGAASNKSSSRSTNLARVVSACRTRTRAGRPLRRDLPEHGHE